MVKMGREGKKAGEGESKYKRTISFTHDIFWTWQLHPISSYYPVCRQLIVPSMSDIPTYNMTQLTAMSHLILFSSLPLTCCPVDAQCSNVPNVRCDVVNLAECPSHGHQPPSTVEQLRAAVLDAWEQLPTEDIDGHIWKMGDHVEAVLAAKGGHTAF